MLHALLMIVHFFCAAGIVALVLLQRGKGAEAGAGFGSGASGTVFGARGATTALSRATAVLAGLFMLTSLSLAYVGSHETTSSSSLLDRMSQQQSAPTAPKSPVPLFGAPAGAGQTPPGTAPSTAPQTPATGPAPPPQPPASPNAGGTAGSSGSSTGNKPPSGSK
jgi:preprotein translocase subunit SecG